MRRRPRRGGGTDTTSRGRRWRDTILGVSSLALVLVFLSYTAIEQTFESVVEKEKGKSRDVLASTPLQEHQEVREALAETDDAVIGHVPTTNDNDEAEVTDEMPPEQPKQADIESQAALDAKPASDGKKPTVVTWLMSFPNSGTTYTMQNVEHISNLTVGTNEPSNPSKNLLLREEWPEGPFTRGTKYAMGHNIMVKTHCDGICDDCPFDQSLRTAEEFETGCGMVTTSLPEGGTRLSWYPSSRVSSAIHLVRDPMDNIVSRMHHAKWRRKNLGWTEEELNVFSDDRAGLMAWCNYTDSKFLNGLTSDSSDEVLKLLPKVPCHADIFRYVQWHSNAIATTEWMQIPTHILRYESYSESYDDTVDQLFAFLGMSRVNEPLDFTKGKFYRDLYTAEEVEATGRLVRLLAPPDCWNLVRQYFATESLPSLSSATESDNKPTQVTWLMSFPNSGTTYTMQNVEHISNLTVGTNEPSDPSKNLLIREEWPEGPFTRGTRYAMGHNIMVKTHCHGICDDCPFEQSLRTAEEFETGCGMVTTSLPEGGTRLSWYPSSQVSSAIHLVRDPMDNIVSRMHHAKWRRKNLGWTEEELSVFSDDRKGLLAWCNYTDSKFFTGLTSDSSGEVLKLLPRVPCHADIFRYVQWHSNAIATTKRLQIPTQILYYESYSEQYNQTTNELLAFLGFTKVNGPLDFVKDKTYHNLFAPEEIEAMGRLVQLLATPECWLLVKRYFPSLIEQGASESQSQ